MNATLKSAARWVGAAAGVATAGYATFAAVSWLRYGKPDARNREDRDRLLDLFMPEYDVVERHQIRVDAPADVTFDAACRVRLEDSPVIRSMFAARKWVLRSPPATPLAPRGLLEWTKAMGWGVLAELPNREVILGAVTRPWEANVVFRPLPPNEFRSFSEPGFVKIAWTLRADPVPGDPVTCIARTETRVATTSPDAREKFRRYWSMFSPGIVVIRHIALSQLRTDAERRVREANAASPAPAGR